MEPRRTLPASGESRERGWLAQNQPYGYGYRPEAAPPDPGAVAGSEVPRFYLDRFGRHFKVYRAVPFRPGMESHRSILSDRPATVLAAPPPVSANPLEPLRGPQAADGMLEKARPLPPGENRYPLATAPGALPDLSRYPQPPADRDWRSEPILQRTEPELTPAPKAEWPAALRRPDSGVPPLPERMVPAGPPESPADPWEQPAIHREKASQAPVGQTNAGASREAPATGKPADPAPPPDPFAHLPFGKPVPGKKGFVTLEAHPNLPEIDVRGIAPGTPVEFPDPREPGQIIQFRVPKFE